MLAVVGTVPQADFPLVSGSARLEGDHLRVGEERLHVGRGTPALLAAACQTAAVLGQGAPWAFLVGDIGRGDGSRSLYAYLEEHLADAGATTVVFHYVQPDVDWHNRVLFAIEKMPRRPFLIADAGYMYAAKMSGQAGEYDLFTPDAGELAFLADEVAPHPFYTRGFILQEDNHIPDLINRAYAHDNAARYLLVKGKHDYLASREGILEVIREPVVEALEPIGGTGDTLTGMVAVLIDAGEAVRRAAVRAAGANRLGGRLAQPTPATPVREIIAQIPAAMARTAATRAQA